MLAIWFFSVITQLYPGLFWIIETQISILNYLRQSCCFYQFFFFFLFFTLTVYFLRLRMMHCQYSGVTFSSQVMKREILKLYIYFVISPERWGGEIRRKTRKETSNRHTIYLCPWFPEGVLSIIVSSLKMFKFHSACSRTGRGQMRCANASTSMAKAWSVWPKTTWRSQTDKPHTNAYACVFN